jgi:GT2 family glycosyltransferase
MSEDVSVVVVTWNSLATIEQCLSSVRGYETIVVDNGSTDATAAFVAERFPEVTVICQGNLGMGAGNNTGMRAAAGRYVFLLNADAWVLEDGLQSLVARADSTPQAAVIGPRLRNPDGTLQRSIRGDPTLWRLATEYLYLRKLAPNSRLLNAFYGGGRSHDREQEVESLYGAALLVRVAAAEEVGLFDESFFMFSEETDWLYRFREAGWSVLYSPAGEVVHVGGASHGGGLYIENLRGILRFLDKHRGRSAAERARHLLACSLALRGALYRGERGERYRAGARFLASGSTPTLLQ